MEEQIAKLRKEVEKCEVECFKNLDDKNHKNLRTWVLELQECCDKDMKELDANLKLDEEIEWRRTKIYEKQAALDNLEGVYKMKGNYKWFALITAVIIVWVSVYYGILPAINFLFLSTKSSDVLEAALVGDDKFFKSTYQIEDIVTQDMLITAWDLNNRTPRFFTKLNKLAIQDSDANHNMPLAKMVVASASTPYYFKPATIDGSFYISGENVAMSPAMFAYFYANEQLGKQSKNIRVVSVGATNEMAEKIDKKASVLSWATRLSTLVAPVKKHTQDYMLSAILEKNGHELAKFELDTSKEFETDLYMKKPRMPDIK